eukprot:gene3281-4110_t
MSISGVGPTTGIYFVFSQISRFSGSSVPFSMIIAAICCLSMASTISSFSRYISTSASFYSFVSMSGLGGEVGFMTGWLMFVGYGILAVQTTIQFSSWTADVITKNTGFDCPWIIFAVAVLLFVSSLAYIGINPALKLSLILVCCEAVVTIAFCLIVIIKGGAEGNYPLSLTPVGPYSGGFQGMAQGLVYSILAFVGFETAAILGQETRNPRKSIPQGVIGSILLTSAYMTFGVYAMVVAAGPSNLFTLYLVDAPIDRFARQYVGNWFAVIVDIAGISTTFNVCTVSYNNFYRILYSIGKTELNRPISLLSRTSSRKTPVVSIILFTIVILICCGVIAATFGIYTSGSWRIYGYLSFIGTLPLLMVFIITNIAVIPYIKFKQPQDYNIFFHMILPLLSALLFFAVLFGNFYPKPETEFIYYLIGLGCAIFLGIILMFILRRKKGVFEKMVLMVGSDGSDVITAGSGIPDDQYNEIDYDDPSYCGSSSVAEGINSQDSYCYTTINK